MDLKIAQKTCLFCRSYGTQATACFLWKIDDLCSFDNPRKGHFKQPLTAKAQIHSLLDFPSRLKTWKQPHRWKSHSPEQLRKSFIYTKALYKNSVCLLFIRQYRSSEANAQKDKPITLAFPTYKIVIALLSSFLMWNSACKTPFYTDCKILALK